MLGHRELTLDDYLGILRRRRWVILIPALLGPVVVFLVSLLIPNKYTSQTLVLVEQQKVPDSYVRSVVTDQLNNRLSTMKEQILSRTRLEPIIERFGLYKEDVGTVPMEVLVGRLRSSIQVNPVMAPGRARGDDVPGFYISVVASEPRTAQQVCAEITSMFMTENLQLREQRAESTTDFLAKQLEEAKRKLDDQDQRLAVFKQRYVGQLPGQEQINMNVLMGLNSQLEAVTQSLNRAQQDKAYTESLLAQQVAAWQASQAGGVNPDTLEQQLKILQNNLVTLEARYTNDHPDVIKTKNDIAQLEKQIKKIKNETKEGPVGDESTVALSEPPQILQLRNQVRIAEQAIAEKSRQQERLQEQIKIYQARVQLSPVVEQQFKELTRDYETALNFYNELLAKKTNSQMATDLERRQQGEQFRVMDPANLPQRPTFPNRPLFALGGLAGGVGLGLGITLLLEMRDKSLRTDKDVEFFLGLPTLALLPSVDATDGAKSSVWKHAARGKRPTPARIGA